MKKLSCFLVAMLFLLMPALQSWDDNDGYSIGQFGGSWATVRVLSGNTYYLDSDYYGTLWPAASNVYGFRPVDGQRLAVLFNPLYDNFDNYDLAVKVENVFPILTKQVETLTAENEEEIGNDPVTIFKDRIWIANGYLNVVFRQDKPVYTPHLVSLVHNTLEVPEEDDYVHLEFRYNTYGDLSGRWGDEAVSFNLNSVDFEGKKGLKLKLNSAVNDEVEITFNIKETMSVPEAVLNLDYSELEADKVK